LYINTNLHHSGLVLAAGSEESGEAGAGTIGIIADTSARAVTSSLITISIKGISARGALLLVTNGSTVARVANTSDVLHGIPRGSIDAFCFRCQVFLRPAGSSVVTVIRAQCTLAGNSFIPRKALALASGAVAVTLVGALHPGVQVICSDNTSNPGKVFGAGSQ
jgi:hypothetical protein